MTTGTWETTADSWMHESARSESVDGDAGPAFAAHTAAATRGMHLGWDPYDVWLKRIRLPREQRLLGSD